MQTIPRELASMIFNYFAKIRDMVRGFMKTLEALNSMDLSNAYRSLEQSIAMDTEADEIRRSILERMGGNSLDAKTRDDVARLLRMMDKSSEWIKEALRYLDVIPYLEIPSEIRRDIEELAKLNLEAVETLGKALSKLMSGEDGDVHKLCVAVERIEEKGDEVVHRVRKNMVKYGAKLASAALTVLLMDFVKSLENALDYAEDVADILRVLALRIGDRRATFSSP